VVLDADTSVTARFGPDDPLPLPPSGLHFVSWAGDGRANLTFVDNSDNEDGFIVYVNGVRSRPVLGRNVTAFPLDAGCDPRDVYVTAHNAAGESGPSNTITVRDESDCIEAPSGLHIVSLYYGEAYLEFLHDGSNVDGFRIYVNGVPFSTLGRTVTTFSIDAECDPKSVYVTAYNAGGESGPSNTVTVVDPDECPPVPPAPPSGLAEVARGGEPEWARFTFVDNSNNEDGFRVYISWGPGEGRQAVLPANQTSFQEILQICEASLVWVKAFNSAGESGPSNTVNVVGPCS
jgi:hypothetical protein